MVIGDKDRIGAFGCGEQFARGGLCGAVIKISFSAGEQVLPGLRQPGAKARFPVNLRGSAGKARHIGDALVAERAQIVSQRFASGKIVRGDG